MVLSVGMIVKNEEKYLRMCLEALKPVLDEVGGELIITDTGSSDGTVRIAEEFTDKVYYFEWCDDYSKARNTTVKRAKGEWYMFVDADEILQKPDELINFFRSGEYRTYDGATVIIRNKDGQIYSDFNALRLTKRTPDVKFYYPIHEGLYPVGSRKKNINAVFDHYGYVTGRAHTKKNKRYIESIRKACAQYPEDVRMMAHLADAYGGGRDNYSALKTVLCAVRICREEDYDICVLYEKAIRTCYNAGDDFQLINIAEKYFRTSKKEAVTNINIYTYMIYAYFRAKDHKKVIECFKRYDRLRRRILDEGFVTEDISSVVLEISDKAYVGILTVLMYSYEETGDTESAAEIMDKMYSMNVSDSGTLNNIITVSYDIYNKTRSEEIIIKLYKYLCGTGRTDLIYIFLCRRNFEDVSDIFRILHENDGDISDICGVYYYGGKNSLTPELLSGVNKKAFPELIYFMIKYDMPVDAETKRAVCEGGAIPAVLYKYDDICSVLFKGIQNEADTMLVIVLCEGILRIPDRADSEMTDKVRTIYYGALSDMFERNMNEEFPAECIFAVDKITRSRYMYKKFYDAKRDNDEKTMNEIRNRMLEWGYLPEESVLKLFSNK